MGLRPDIGRDEWIEKAGSCKPVGVLKVLYNDYFGIGLWMDRVCNVIGLVNEFRSSRLVRACTHHLKCTINFLSFVWLVLMAAFISAQG